MKQTGWIWSATKQFMKISGIKSHWSGKQICTNRANNAETQTFQIVRDIFAVQILIFHLFLRIQTMLEFYTYRHVTESSLNAKW